MTESVNNFMRILGDQPLSLALVVVVLLLIWFLFKVTSTFNAARTEGTKLLVAWQKETQEIMANCVSKENLAMIISALERDRQTYRAMLPTYTTPQPGAPMAPPTQDAAKNGPA
jgi:hypothetical protein